MRLTPYSFDNIDATDECVITLNDPAHVDSNFSSNYVQIVLIAISVIFDKLYEPNSVNFGLPMCLKFELSEFRISIENFQNNRPIRFKCLKPTFIYMNVIY